MRAPSIVIDAKEALQNAFHRRASQPGQTGRSLNPNLILIRPKTAFEKITNRGTTVWSYNAWQKLLPRRTGQIYRLAQESFKFDDCVDETLQNGH